VGGGRGRGGVEKVIGKKGRGRGGEGRRVEGAGKSRGRGGEVWKSGAGWGGRGGGGGGTSWRKSSEDWKMERE